MRLAPLILIGAGCCAPLAVRAQGVTSLGTTSLGTTSQGGSPGTTSQGASSLGESSVGASSPGFPAPSPPAAPSLLPLTGVSTRVGDLRAYLQDSFGEPVPPEAVATPAWQITPRLQLSEVYTDNATGTGTSRRSDLITAVNPSISVSGDTARIKANLDYSPSYDVYAFTSGQNRLDQNLNANVLAAIVPGEVDPSAQGSIAQESRYGTAGPSGTTSLSRQDQLQTTSFAVTPYLSHSFGGAGTLQVGAAYIYSSTEAPAGGGTTDSASFGPSLPGNFGNATLRTTREFLSFLTGENLGRFQDGVQIDAYQFDGTGVLQNASRVLAANDVAYALTRSFDALGELGYEQVHYSGMPPVRIDDAVWAFGGRWRPNADSTATVEYRHRDGFNSLFVDATYQVTARLRVFGTYSEGLATTQEELQGSLLLSNLDRTGNPLNSVTGAPLLFSSDFFGFETDLFRIKRLSTTAALLLGRDTVSATVQRENRTLAATTSPGTANTADRSTVGTLTWSHQLSPSLNSNALLQYGTRTPTGVQSQTEDLWGATASLAKTFTPTLTGTVQYSFNRRSSDFQGRSMSENLVIVALQKSF